jgi:hypothetical protein
MSSVGNWTKKAEKQPYCAAIVANDRSTLANMHLVNVRLHL